MDYLELPDRPADGTLFFHDDKVFVYHSAENTWECRTVGDIQLTQSYINKIVSQYGS